MRIRDEYALQRVSDAHEVLRRRIFVGALCGSEGKIGAEKRRTSGKIPSSWPCVPSSDLYAFRATQVESYDIERL